MLLSLLFACPSQTTPQQPTTIRTQVEKADFFVSWSETGISVRVENATAGSWWFGLAETSSDNDNLWTGEDCYTGDLLYDVTPILWCHPIQATGTNLQFGGDPANLQPGQETAMSPASISRSPMYYFFEIWTEECFISGPGASSYERLCQNPANLTVLSSSEEDTASE